MDSKYPKIPPGRKSQLALYELTLFQTIWAIIGRQKRQSIEIAANSQRVLPTQSQKWTNKHLFQPYDLVLTEFL